MGSDKNTFIIDIIDIKCDSNTMNNKNKTFITANDGAGVKEW